MRTLYEKPIKYVPVEKIALEDRFYSIRPFCFNAETLIKSIKITGITTPVILEPLSPERLRIVSGFRRVQAAVEAGQAEIPGITDYPGGALEKFWRIVQENYGSQELHELEYAEIIGKLKELHGVDDESLLSRFLPQMGLRDSRYELERFLALAGLNDHLKKACYRGNLLCATALEIRTWPVKEQEFLTSLVSRMMLGTNKQKQVVRLIEDLKKKTGDSLESIWATTGLLDTGQEELSFEKIHGRLSAMRYPTLSKSQQEFTRLKEEILPGRRIRLQAPRYFDGEQLTVSFSATDAFEFRKKAQQLLEASSRQELKEMFSLL